jgi:hypothetical protein
MDKIIFLSGYQMDETFGKQRYLIRASLSGMNNTVGCGSDGQYLRWETGWMVPSLGGGIDRVIPSSGERMNNNFVADRMNNIFVGRRHG